MNKNYILSLGGWTRLWLAISLFGFILICAASITNSSPEWLDFYDGKTLKIKSLKYVTENIFDQFDPASATAAPICKNGAANCEPWERDWSKTEPKVGSIVTEGGLIATPTASAGQPNKGSRSADELFNLIPSYSSVEEDKSLKNGTAMFTRAAAGPKVEVSSDLYREVKIGRIKSEILEGSGFWLLIISTLFATGHTLQWVYRGFRPKKNVVPPA